MREPGRRRAGADRSPKGAGIRQAGLALLFGLDGDFGGGSGVARLLRNITEAGPAGEGSGAVSLRRLARSATVDAASALAAGLAGGEAAALDFDELMRRRWGEDFMDVEATLAALRNLPPATLINLDLAKWLIEHRADASITEERWRQAQTYCVLADVYLRDLRTLLRRSARRKADPGNRLLQSMLDLAEPGGVEAVKRAAEAKEGWLTLSVHSGPSRYGKWLRNKFVMDDDILVLGAGRERHSTQFATVRTDPARAFLLMIRHLRQDGTATIAVDGQYGKSSTKLNILDKELNFANGSPHAIYYAKCQNTLFMYRWHNDKVVIDMHDGPVPALAESIDDWTLRWFGWLRKYLEGHVTGDPVNIRGYSGLWSKLSREDDEPDEA
ncbi:MAG TPA: hypothetical protein VF559_05530 [Caulobacteraceae bacterium]|jgi:hypothetical protein